MICGIYLAAGQSQRMGCPKLDLPLNGKYLGSISLETALNSQLDKVIVVVNQEGPLTWLSANFLDSHPNCMVKRSKLSNQGQAVSLKAGLKIAQDLQADAVMVLLADQPFISQKLLDRLISIYKIKRPNFIASSFNGIQRPPIIINSILYPELWKLKGDTGARHIIRNNNQGIIVKENEELQFIDVDTPQQYESLIKLIKSC
ncbi:NTP transferase domain-containing protein [Alkalihalophilus lindianensis]|uniref:NTP transferase domain-containing protein n=1 Tax=Alkalihalophilus lindianensis TaxID=1630542 RepID=A0ABU3X830_9BACI|nr:NTP transferase domain-containing protein [Alkalihalophilus lindianensis]MDV2684051.1 NTP transferase domain-containing protein [Alkalihalophilus lindianensis]